MPYDLRALLAAIVADPADDTARLVYADCLEEHGNSPRAEFIRLQIEAERLHPHSHAQAVLEGKAEALLEEHWIEWWGEVCATVGMPVPVPKRTGTLGRLAHRIGLGQPAGHPYQRSRFQLVRRSDALLDQRLNGWSEVTFHRGFVDSLHIRLAPNIPRMREVLQKWPQQGPLANLTIRGPWPDVWLEGPHLTGIRSLTLIDFDEAVFRQAIRLPHLVRLTELALQISDLEEEGLRPAFADELAELASQPVARQLKRLKIPVWDDEVAEVLAGAASLAGLESLEVEMESPYDELIEMNHRLSRLARAPVFSNLRELTVIGGFHESQVEAVIRNPVWTGLRKLGLYTYGYPSGLDPLTGPDDLTDLEELQLMGVSYSTAQVALLIRAPILKRLKHFTIRGWPANSVDFDIARTVDIDRIETFAIGASEVSRRVIAQLRDHFGDRLRILS